MIINVYLQERARCSCGQFFTKPMQTPDFRKETSVGGLENLLRGASFLPPKAWDAETKAWFVHLKVRFVKTKPRNEFLVSCSLSLSARLPPYDSYREK